MMSTVAKLNSMFDDDSNILEDYVLDALSTTDKRRNAQIGKKHSEATKRKMSLSQTGRVVTADAKANMSAAQKGKRHSPRTDETKEKLRQANTGFIHNEITCPYCGQTGGETSMKRWHMERCFYKTISNIVLMENLLKDMNNGIPRKFLLKKYSIDGRKLKSYIEEIRIYLKEQSSENYH